MENRKKRKMRYGTVISDKMEKTVIVKVERKLQHPRYGKIIKRDSRFFADNPDNKAKAGSKVKIMETRPLSKNKRWRVVEVIEN